ncbi:uncharacterized protein LOC115881446 [Sitophilus oryzae]|uniref:Uncharacterized protein LOC115881446 n=1 Tax=Sitophilus oryzae TaxID=7048 RepID=A0A6J2XUS0_SITOR|nr:uncharacterized protein LOC115881446 [Sitophilus oryzae]
MLKNMFLLSCLITMISTHIQAYPTNEDYKFIDREYASPGAHQLASWLAYQLKPKEFIPPLDVPIIPYRLPVQNGKRNSEVTNAMVGSEETQKMYREGRK